MKLALQNPYRLHVSPQGLENRTLTHRMGALAGEAPATFYGGTPPAYFWKAADQAAALGYSVPYNAMPALTGAGIQYVNPDGTVGQLLDWQDWPLRVTKLAPGSACPPGGCLGPDDPSFVSPPDPSIWFNYMTSLGVADIAAIQSAASAAAAAFAQNALNTSNPGVNPSTYGQGPSGIMTPAGNAPSLSFTTSRGTTSGLKVGDSWTVTITNAAPNQPVTVYGVHPDGTTGTLTAGNTDGSGNFKLSGTFDSTTIGTWQETWSVGNVQVGSFSFSISALSSGTSSNNPPLGTGAGSGSGSQGSGGGTGNTGGTGAGGFDMSFLTNSSIISGVPNYLIFGGGLLALMMVAK